MLKALYDYGIQNVEVISPGFMLKTIHWYILLSSKGDYLGLQQCEDEKQICPDIGSDSQSADKCNPLVEKAEIILGKDGKKPDFFRQLLRDGSSTIPAFRLCLQVLETPEILETIRDEARKKNIKGKDRITFRVAGKPLPKIDGVYAWWVNYRQHASATAGKKSKVRCLITGAFTTPLDTVPVIHGLQSVGGHPKGSPLICFDKAAFQSYGLKKCANAPVSEEAFSVVKDALNDLLDGSPAMYRREKKRKFYPVAPVFAGLKFVHWYDCPLAPEEDLIHQDLFGFTWEEEADAAACKDETTPSQDLPVSRTQADRLIQSITSGATRPTLDCQYHILLISGANGRAMIRRYERGNYGELQRNLELWKQDLSLTNNLGSGSIRPHKLVARLIRLVRNQRADNLIEQMKKELAGITPAILLAIINGTALPDTVAARALAYIHSQIYEQTDQTFIPDDIACQWLKVWLSRRGRNRNEEVSKLEYFNPEYSNAAYHCGALMAIYADLQRAAMKDVNADVVNRYYASASRTPTLVLGILERMASFYLEKLEKSGKPGSTKKKWIEARLNQEYAFFDSKEGRRLPHTLNLEEQSYFALGYRQMCAQITHDKLNSKANRTEEA